MWNWIKQKFTATWNWMKENPRKTSIVVAAVVAGLSVLALSVFFPPALAIFFAVPKVGPLIAALSFTLSPIAYYFATAGLMAVAVGLVTACVAHVEYCIESICKLYSGRRSKLQIGDVADVNLVAKDAEAAPVGEGVSVVAPARTSPSVILVDSGDGDSLRISTPIDLLAPSFDTALPIVESVPADFADDVPPSDVPSDVPATDVRASCRPSSTTFFVPVEAANTNELEADQAATDSLEGGAAGPRSAFV